MPKLHVNSYLGTVMNQFAASLLGGIVTASLIASPAQAEVNAAKLGEIMNINRPVAMPSVYNKGCIFKGHGASVAYWYVLKPSVCTNAIGSAWGKEQRLENFVKRGYGFKIHTICTSSGTAETCEGKPSFTPFSPWGRTLCIKPVKSKGWSSVVCVEGLPLAQKKQFLLSLVAIRGGESQ